MTFAILEYPGCLASNVAGWREILALSARADPASPAFKERPPAKADLILLPGSLGAGSGAPLAAGIPALIRKAHARGAVIAAACSGLAAVLEAGIDGGRAVTTHWSLAAEFASRWPGARIDASRLLIDQGDLITAGGVLSWADLGLHLVARFASAAAARSCARILVWDPGRSRQSPYADPGVALKPPYPDPLLSAAEAWIGANLSSCSGVAEWAAAAGLGKRSLERRWAASYGASPAAWLRDARIARARELLESSDEAWERIATACGYADPGRFRELFARKTGWSPRRYRKAFGPGA